MRRVRTYLMPEKDTEAVKEHHDGVFDFSFDFCKWMSDIIEPQGRRSYDVEKDNEMIDFMFTKTREGGGVQYYSSNESMRGTDEGEGKGISNLSMQDKFSIGVLLLLYTLQGIPMGLAGAIPLLLKEKNVSFEALALFSLVTIPFSLKLLWAPLVDSMYIKALGRRKTWLLPVQIACGILMITGSSSIHTWMNPIDGGEPNVFILTIYFVVLYFLMATQDIAVDGWALTMLSKDNVGYASTCNSIGQSFGFFLSNQGFIAMSDETWCNRFLGMEKGQTLLNLPQFMIFWGVVFVATTIMIWIFKKEEELSSEEVPEGLVDTYKHVVSIFKLRPVQTLCLILFTSKIAFAPADSVFQFKLQEYGMPKADIATISPLLLIVGLVLPAIVSDRVSKKPIDMFINIGMPLKLVTSALTWLVFQYAIYTYNGEAEKTGNKFPHKELFYSSLIIVMVIHELAGTLVFVSLMSFFNRISDPAIGGTYMTLLNTITNLGSKWPNSTVLWLLPKVTWTDGIGKNTITVLDGFTTETVIAIAIGIAWMIMFRNIAKRIQTTAQKDWYVTKGNDNKKM